MQSKICSMVLISILSCFLLAQLSFNFSSAYSAQPACLDCHEGIEPIGTGHESLSCEDCHSGNPASTDFDAAHENLNRDPGDLNIVDQTCGPCHSEIVERVKKSLHATSAGIISGARYLWAAQPDKNASFSIRPVQDDDGDVPAEFGAVKSLKQLPHYSESNHPVDDYLRNQCLRCHLWTRGKQQPGDYRGGGCSACHVLYADDGLSRSGDQMIPKDAPGHPIRHEITVRIPSQQCVHCHNRGGRTGVSYLGMMESDGYGTPFRADGSKQQKLHGKHYNHLQKDLHYDAGMHCVDCHTLNDIHGDGNIYSKREQAVEIECRDCHGDPEHYSALKTSRGNLMTNLERQNDQVFLRGKIDGRQYDIPQLRALADRHNLPVAMQIKNHIEKLECYACHAKWAPQCYGCHAKLDMRKTGYDWIDDKQNATYKWQESRSYLRWETPVLGINSEGKVSPFITGCQAIFTHIGKDGKAVDLNKVYQTAHGHYGIAHNPIQPHTISKKPRTCENCHSQPKALGLGSGHYYSKFNGLDIPFELERIVDEDGNQIQATSHVGARPFNKEEIEKIKRINLCQSCHQETPTEFWEKVVEKWGQTEDSKAHHDHLRQVLREAAR